MDLNKQISEFLEYCRNRRIKVVTAESCTGGMIASLITEIPGSSDVFECGFVTYSNASKVNLLGVDSKIIEKYGAVSEEVAKSMAIGAIEKTGIDLAISITGIAGPGGGSSKKPVGLVYIAATYKNNFICKKNNFSGNRAEIRIAATTKAIEILSEICYNP